jgi:PST family polysaccharide transporter
MNPSHAERPESGIWQAFARGVRNNILGEIGVQLVRIGGMVMLARALAPSDFGLFNEFGVPDTLVQRHDLRADHESTAAWANLAITMCTAGLLYAGAPLIARAMAMQALPPALRLLCIPLAFEGFASVSTARLTRRLDFARLAMAEVSAELAFVAAAIALLVMGLPRWSLAGGLAARLCAHALTLYSAEPYLPHGKPSRRALSARLCRRCSDRKAAGQHLQ